ncbi:MAG: uncharacterized protein H6Q31_2051 [Bacteroidetes bacterium]|nr:uncharacterized protein [Bacteroidota bacterium]
MPTIVCGPRIVRDHDDGLLELLVQAIEQRHHFARRNAVQVAGRFVRHQHRRIGDQCPRNGHALFLSARKLLGVVLHTVREADHRKGCFNVLAAFPAREFRKQEWQLHILECCQHREQVIELENEPDVIRAPLGEGRLAQRGDLGSVDGDGSLIRTVDAGDEIQQGGLSGSGRTHHSEELSVGNGDADVVQHGDEERIAMIRFGYIADFNHKELRMDNSRLIGL